MPATWMKQMPRKMPEWTGLFDATTPPAQITQMAASNMNATKSQGISSLRAV